MCSDGQSKATANTPPAQVRKSANTSETVITFWNRALEIICLSPSEASRISVQTPDANDPDANDRGAAMFSLLRGSPVRCSVLSQRLSFCGCRVEGSGEPGVVRRYSGRDEPAIQAQVLVGQK